MVKAKDAFIPNTPAELTAAWVGEALRTAGADASVSAITVEPLGGGVGMTGQTVRVRIDGDGAPGTAVAKYRRAPCLSESASEPEPFPGECEPSPSAISAAPLPAT